MIKFNRLRISNDATAKLKVLKTRTGLTPNILCRLALCFSLENEKPNNLIPMDENGQEFNKHTLLGEDDAHYVSLVKQRCLEDGLDPEKEFLNQMRLHINHGVTILSGRIKSIGEVTNLLKGRL